MAIVAVGIRPRLTPKAAAPVAPPSVSRNASASFRRTSSTSSSPNGSSEETCEMEANGTHRRLGLSFNDLIDGTLPFVSPDTFLALPAHPDAVKSSEELQWQALLGESGSVSPPQTLVLELLLKDARPPHRASRQVHFLTWPQVPGQGRLLPVVFTDITALSNHDKIATQH